MDMEIVREKIEITLNSIDQDTWLVELSSDSVFPTTLFNFGKNKHNLDALIEKL